MSTPSREERQRILDKREGYVRAFSEIFGQPPNTWKSLAEPPMDWKQRAAEAYPLPLKRVPREAVDEIGTRWRVQDGGLVYLASGGWESVRIAATAFSITRKRVALWADLFTNPDVLVPDSGEDTE